MGELTSHKDGHLVRWKPTRGQEVFKTRDNCYESKLCLGTKSLINCQKYGAKFLLKETFTQALIDHHKVHISYIYIKDMCIVHNLAKRLVWPVWFTNSALKVTRLCMESHITWSSTPILVRSQPAHVSEYKCLSSAFLFSSILCCLSFWKFACFVHCFVFRLTNHRLVHCRAQSHHCIF